VKQIKNSIGYVEAAYVKQNKLQYVQLQNLAGRYVLPTEESFRASAANAEWDKDSGFYEILTNKPGSDSWPITGATFVLMHKSQSKPAQALQVLKFFEWAYAHGNHTALELDYVPLPDDLVALIKTSWEANIKGKDGRAIYTVSE
jgi:phosphate transport system substrate-binding protein